MKTGFCFAVCLFCLFLLGNANAVDIAACQALNVAGETYDLTADIAIVDSDCFTVEEPNITLNLNGFTVSGTCVVAMQYSGVYDLQRDGLTVQNGQIQGFCTGIRVNSASNVTIDNVTVTSNERFGVSIASGLNNTVSNSTVSSNGQGIIFLTDNSTILNVTANGNAYYGVQLGGSNNTMTNVSMNNNLFNFSLFTNRLDETSVDGADTHSIDLSNTVDGGFFIYYYSGLADAVLGPGSVPNAGMIICASCNNVTIQDFDLSHNNSQGVLLVNTTNSTVRDVAANFNEYGVQLFSSSNILVTGIVAENSVCSEGVAGVGVYFSSFNTISDITVSRNKVGIHLASNSSNNAISGVAASDLCGVTWAAGINISENSNNNSVSNALISSASSGIYIDESSGNQITDVVASDNSNNGVYIRDDSSNNQLTNVTANNNNNRGFYVRDSQNNQIIGSVASGNQEGIYFNNSPNNDTTNSNICFNVTDVECLASDPQTAFAGNDCTTTNGCGAWAVCLGCPAIGCSVDSIVSGPPLPPGSVFVGDDALVSISYFGFGVLPVPDAFAGSWRCGTGSGATNANFACVGLPDGTCTYDCQNYLNPGVYGDVFAQVTEGAAGPPADCGAIPVTVLVPEVCGDGAITGGEACDIGLDANPGTGDDVDAACPGFCELGCTCGGPPACFNSFADAFINVGDDSYVEFSFDNFVPLENGPEQTITCSDIDGAVLPIPVVNPVTCIFPTEICSFTCGPYNTFGINVLSISLDDSLNGAFDCGTTNITVTPIAVPGDPSFDILSFDIFPSTVIFDSPGVETVEPVVEITNWGDFAPGTLEIRVLDSSGATVALQSASRDIDTDDVVVFRSPVDDISFVVPSSWGTGIYTVYANVFDSDGVLNDSVVRHLNIGFKSVPVPEGSPLLLPLIAFSVLAVIFLSRKRRS